MTDILGHTFRILIATYSEKKIKQDIPKTAITTSASSIKKDILQQLIIPWSSLDFKSVLLSFRIAEIRVFHQLFILFNKQQQSKWSNKEKWNVTELNTETSKYI